MSSDFAPTLQKKFHEKIVPALLNLLDDNLNPRVQAHAGNAHYNAFVHSIDHFNVHSFFVKGAALVNFAEDCPKHILVQYLNDIMLKLESILNAKFKEVRHRILEIHSVHAKFTDM